jgi:hypothetical protein
MKLYKFRSLGSCQDLERAQEILETGKFWCSRFWELNDPMEGVYLFTVGTLAEQLMDKLYSEKSKRAICSFSGEKAFDNPIMWGYYANGFKGIAIEVEVDGDGSKITKVNYANELAKITDGNQPAEKVNSILTTKLCCWSHEHEYRYLAECSTGPWKIGRITAVYYGDTDSALDNAKEIQSLPGVRKYLCRVKSVKEIALRKDIKCHPVDVVDGVVQIAEVDDKGGSHS